jgi:hypothetical protein
MFGEESGVGSAAQAEVTIVVDKSAVVKIAELKNLVIKTDTYKQRKLNRLGPASKNVGRSVAKSAAG